IAADDGHAAALARRVARLRIDDVVETFAVLVEVALVVSRRRERRVGEWQTQEHLALVIRIAHAHHPGLAEAIADDARVAAGVDHGAIETLLPQDLDAAIDGIPLGDAADLDADSPPGGETREHLL